MSLLQVVITTFYILNILPCKCSSSSSSSTTSLCIQSTNAFQTSTPSSSLKKSTTRTATTTIITSTTKLHASKEKQLQKQLPSWSNIESILNPSLTYTPSPIIIDSALNPTSKPSFSQDKPTLFRERHGWCPYSERVWLALEVVDVEYDTIYIDNTGCGRRPSYYSGQTPQIRWEDGSSQGESMDLVRKIHSKYYNGNGDGVNLYPEEIQNEVINKIRAFDQIYPKRTRPSSRAAFLFRYDGEPLWKNEFEKVLRETNELLGSTAEDGPFFCGKDFTAADIAWAPFLERYAAQLPCLHEGLHPRTDEGSYPHLVRWYNAMDEYVPSYACRVKGDASSWRKVLTMAGFGNAGVPMDVSKRMDGVQEEEQKALTVEEEECQQKVWDAYASTRPWVASSPALEAASVMTRNRDAILKDIQKRVGTSSKNKYSELGSSSEGDIDEAMRAMICLLCEDEDAFQGSISMDGAKTYAQIIEDLATYLDDRMCVPRDMGCPSAATIKRLIPRMASI